MSREELLNKTKEEVSAIAKGYGVTRSIGSKRKTKEQLVEEILKVDGGAQTTETAEVPDEEWNPTETTAEVAEEEVKVEKAEVVDEAVKEQRRKEYIENVKIGTLVAFKSLTGKVKSAKVVKRSSKNRKLKVETKYGAEFVISYDDVIWVRTNKRWPKGVYQLLKGVTNDEVKVEE